ncbi:ABC-2 type transport system permease protein [Paenibacillus sp. UNC496MF]|uniref:ABC transporter permease n=1 Tax=Paenibacillus sp. UNC496MF TaxID=1502753 RepID=UPI0008E0CC4D|nr:ABC-2 family transporter protein [Paenibacillus sp. UNC496MF]SFI59400.1 ABC-2 type transport system permease protein [Paenibacillus sp. UNC496MF]
MSTADNERARIGKEKPPSWARRAAGTLAFLLTCWKVNLASAMEYRASFFLMAGMMFINNFMWLFFWSLFFGKFPVVNGWGLNDVMLMWAVGAGGFGWANLLFGNFNRIAPIVASGQLDVYLSQPKPVLLHVLASRMSLTAAGDFAFGLVVYAWVGDHSVKGVLLFAAALLISGTIFMGVVVLAGSLAFFMGNAEGFAQQVFNSFVALSTYPSDIFKGLAKALLFTALPAGFISFLPIGLMRDADPAFAWKAVAAALLFGAAAVLAFRLGLKRYASGNAIVLRG